MEEEKLCNDGGGGKGERLHLLELLLLLSSPPMGGECLGVKTGFLQFTSTCQHHCYSSGVAVDFSTLALNGLRFFLIF